jgi:WD40 repeat protein
MGLVQAAWEGGRVGEVLRLLDREKADNHDLCGFEWNYWKRQCNQDIRSINIPDLRNYGVFSADGTRIASCTGETPLSRDGSGFRQIGWTVWDTATGKKTGSFEFPEGDGRLPSLSTDGSLMAISLQTSDDKVRGKHEHLLISSELSTGHRLATLRHLENSPYVLAFSSDGRKLAGVVTPHGAQGKPVPGAALHIWDARTGNEIRVLPGTMGTMQCPAFSPDGSRVAAAVLADGSQSLTEAKIWELESGRVVASFPTASSLQAPILSLCFSPDGQALAVVGEEPAGCVLEVWDLKTKRCRFTLHGRSRRFQSQTFFSPDSRWIAYPLGQFQLGVWDASSGKELAHYQGHREPLIAVGFSRDGRTLLSADESGTVKAWDVPASATAVFGPVEEYTFTAAPSPDAQRIATVTGNASSPTVRVWDTTCRPLLSLKRSVAPDQERTHYPSLRFSARGDRLA